MNRYRTAKRVIGERITSALLERGFGKNHVEQLVGEKLFRGGPSSKTLQVFLQSLWPVHTELELIRVGRQQDGGYIVPNDFSGVRTCFSPGVGDSSDFEDAIYKQFGIQSFLADGTVTGPPNPQAHLSFIKKNIEPYDSESTMTLESWVSTQSSASDELILQMDIEGGEYAALLGLSTERLLQFRILVIEFHDLHAMGTTFGFQIIKAVFMKLLQGFYVVHIHPNNCCSVFNIHGVLVPPVVEFTFLRKDRSQSLGYVRDFPHPLDASNVPRNEQILLPAEWHSS
jgi:hypothetical protein